MKGTILDFSEQTAQGVISGNDGGRYNFDASEWKGGSPARAGVAVDFVVEGDKAQGVYPDLSLATASSKKVAAALFALFLGAFGAHKFYLGYNKQGVIMLVVFLLGFVLLGLPSLVISIIAFVEFILYLIKSDAEFEQTYVTGNRPWF
ncbi:putative membrane protein [Spongiibacter sp. IMCC21906]|uniref:TM2 domain-containing protein n=1 Tax=Spongiibacter sp. IMCC21906 TaxID=1620392 RepID=UPI00062DDA02|nr:TM2 domain-containing protein [Spongiibacter sp. IMCC21906]AKH70456.1 putative membrane protein [Spongiibacter sp. IMCC21906]